MKHIAKFDTFLNESTDDKTPLDNNKVDPQGFGLAYDCLEEVKNAVDNNILKPKKGGSWWRKYWIDVNILRKEVNKEDGYLIDVFIESADGYDIYIGEVRNGRIHPDADNESYQKFMSERKQLTR